jgi:hypothetical protein
MEAYFVLDDRGEPIPEADFEAWSRWFERADRSVARGTAGPDVTVLTTFRGVDSAAAAGMPPLLFESRVFGGILDGEQRLHVSRADALVGHAVLVEWCRIGSLPNHGITQEQIT